LVPPKFLLAQAKTSFRVLSFGNEIKNFGFCFAFRSLIRNFATKAAKLWHLGIKKKRFLLFCARFFVTLQEIAEFLCIKAVWRIEEKMGYELATVLNSTFCYKLHPLELCSLATNGTQERTPDGEPPAVL
jgi:hypothetical protein